VLSATGTNNANWYNNRFTDPKHYLTEVGAFLNSPSPYGTFDQAGDVVQWNDTETDASHLVTRGGSFYSNAGALQSTQSYGCDPTFEFSSQGFRVALVPEPASLGILGLGVIGLAAVRRRRCSQIPVTGERGKVPLS
jgi:formylglycine-generating enzyme